MQVWGVYDSFGSVNYETLGTSVQWGTVRFKNYKTRTVLARVVIPAIKNGLRGNDYGKIRAD